MAGNVHLRDILGTSYSADELGVIHQKGPKDFLETLALVKKGQVYDLDSGRWPDMPVFPAHPPLIMTSYRTPRGLRSQKDLDEWRGKNTANMALNTELIIGTVHTGTHVDTLSHITCGSNDHWYGSYPEADYMGDFGPLSAEASSMPPFICRGVLIDVPAYKGVEILESEYLITVEDVEGALARPRVPR